MGCNCRENIEARLANEKGFREPSINYEVLSGKTFTEITYKERDKRGKDKTKKLMVLHTYCPFCGEKYPEVEEG